MTLQWYNYLDGTIQELSSFFKTFLENLEAPVLATKKPPKKKERGKTERNIKL